MLDQALDIANSGFGHSLGLSVLQSSLGTFFVCSGAHKLFNKQRHETLVRTLTELNVPFIKFNQWWVPGWEFVGGAMLAIGLLPVFAASVLAILILVAVITDCPQRVASFKPIDFADTVDDWLYMPEVLYFIGFFTLVVSGAGYSLL